MTHKTTLPDNEWLTYGCAPAITWLRDADQILLIDAEREQFWSLRGVEAAMWNLMIMAHPYEKTVHLLSLLLKNSTDQAEKVFLTTLDSWHYAGIIQVVEENKRGESSN